MVSIMASPSSVVLGNSPPSSPTRKLSKHFPSSPDFGGVGFDDESIGSSDRSSVAVGDKAVKVRRVPSFKDAILLNAQEKEREDREQKAQQERARVDSLKQRRTAFAKPKFVVKEIKRCTRSTPDLSTCLSKVTEDQATFGGGGGFSITEEDDILGDTDASDYYARKSHGSAAHKNGMRLRPDEAKRKQFTLHKKNMQRGKVN